MLRATTSIQNTLVCELKNMITYPVFDYSFNYVLIASYTKKDRFQNNSDSSKYKSNRSQNDGSSLDIGA